MDIAEYVEKTYGIELLEYQKIYLRALHDEYKNTGDILIPITSRRSCIEFYAYLKQNNLPICKELLLYGTTINCNK